MKIINIFVASSIVTFSKERKQLAAYFCDLNNTLTESGIFFDVKFCEELDNAVPETRKQDEYNAFIAKSDLALFLVNTDCGDYTFEEFHIALHSKNNSRIVVFSQNTEDELSKKILYMKEKATDEVVQFVSFDKYYELENRVKDLVQDLVEGLNIPEVQNSEDLRKVSFFLGASGVENVDEKNEILRFVLGLNEKLLSKKTYVQIVPCAEKTNNELLEDVQQRHENLISNSDAAFFVFFSRVDELTERDLLFAVSQFKKQGSPKIYTYFINQGEDDDSILRAKHYIDQTLNHYYSIFSSVDSIKLSILLRLSEQNTLPLCVENSTIVSHEAALLDVNELSIFSQNKTLNQLKYRLADLTNQYNEAAEEFSINRNKRDLLKLLSDLDDAISELREKIRKEENEALSMLYEMHRNVAKGEMNELMKKAYRLLEKGMIEEAAEILNKDRVDSYYGDRLVDQVATLRSEVDDAIEMYRHTIHIQKMLDESETTVNTIIACYETIMQYITIANPDTHAVVLEYAQYLDEQNNPKAEKILVKAEHLFTNPDIQVSSDMLAKLYLSASKYYLKQYNLESAEKHLKKYYETALKLYTQKPEEFALIYAGACLEYTRINISQKTGIFEQGLVVMEQLFGKTSTMGDFTYLDNMAEYYYERGNRYAGMGDNQTALEAYQKAATLLETHQNRTVLLADIYNNIAELIRSNDNSKASGHTVRLYYDKALEILEALYITAPDICAEALGDVYNNKYVYFLEYGERNYQGLQCLKACEQVYLYWYQKNPRKNGQGLAECYVQMSYVQDSLGNPKRAIDYALKGVEIFEHLAKLNYDRFARKLAWAYNELGLLYILYGQVDLSIDHLCRSMDILEKADSAYIQFQRIEILEKVLLAVEIIEKRGKTDSSNRVYEIIDRIFRFMYPYIKNSLEDLDPGYISTVYSLGEKLLLCFDSLDHERTKQFYYPAVTELGIKRLENPNLSEDEKMFTNFMLATIAGLSGDTEKCESYYQAHLDAFERTDDYKKLERSETRNGSKKKSKKKRWRIVK